MENNTITQSEQTIKCNFCPIRDNCPFKKCYAKTKVKKCTWHDVMSPEYNQFVKHLWKVDPRAASRHEDLYLREVKRYGEESKRELKAINNGKKNAH